MRIDVLSLLGLRQLFPPKPAPRPRSRPADAKARPSGGVKPIPSPVRKGPEVLQLGRNGGKRVEPAVAVIPRDAVQMPPPGAASPGLPPVDPVRRLAPRPVEQGGRAAEWKPGHVADGATAKGDPGRRPGMPERPHGPDILAPIPQQATFFVPEVRQVVEGQERDDPLRDGIPEGIPDAPQKDRQSDPSMDFDGVMEAMVSEITSRAYDPSMDFAQGAEPIVFCDFLGDEANISSEVPRGIEVVTEASSPGFAPRPDAGFLRTRKPVSRSTRVPPRIAERPRAEEWTDEELLTLPEAAALFWPAGPITTNTLRTAGRDGTLAITKVAGKFFTTPKAIRRMGPDGTVRALQPMGQGIAGTEG